jgi:hypothetical protein
VATTESERRLTPAGYEWLDRTFALRCLKSHHTSSIASWVHQRRVEHGAFVEDIYPPAYAPAAGVVPQVEFALKYDGLELGVLHAFFATVNRVEWEQELSAALTERRTGVYLRRTWYLYEEMTGRRLDRPDLDTGNYVLLADPERYYTTPPRRSRRHRVDDNLLGGLGFSPMVRRTPNLAAYGARGLPARAREIVAAYDADTLHRAVAWLYTKETRSSFAIEHEEPSSKRVERFVQLLRSAPQVDRLTQAVLVDLQHAVIDPRFANDGWREDQVYVGEDVGYHQRVHFVAPRPEDLPGLMEAFLSTADRLEVSGLDPVVIAAVVSFGFVFLHPFSDGNGRLHRFLIHRALARGDFVPPGMIFPVSAVMLERKAEYDAALEWFSRPLMELVGYDIDREGIVTVEGQTADLYRFFDATPLVEALYGWIERTIETDLRQELDFMVRFRAGRAAAREIVDLPDRDLDLFVVLVLRGEGHLSATKRTARFARLTDAEVAEMESAIREVTGVGLAPTVGDDHL